MLTEEQFGDQFAKLTGNPPFPWQQALYERFANGDIPASCNLPTGLGKTSAIAVWLIALANGANVPRRLVYVVNRRTVVDQTTDEVEKYRFPLAHRRAPIHPLLLDLADALARLSSNPEVPPLALSTLRGQFADNREWSADPSRPAVICGTVDMIGSRLLFSGYGVGMKGKPLHAGFLGQDSLIVHDEAHLEPAFQTLLETIRDEQARCKDFRPLRVMELTATPRSGGEVFELTPEEKNAPKQLPDKPTEPIHHVWRRTHSKKSLALHEIADEKKELVPKMVQLALHYKDDDAKPAVVVFVRTVDAVNEVVKELKKGKVSDDNILTLTGTMRGYERDQMATANGVFARFRKESPAKKTEGTVYLVCTSAGEVGVDISADHMVCDLSTFDSMAQRFGRVNRYGFGDATIDVVYPKALDTKDKPFEVARERTFGLLKRLRVLGEKLLDASPATLGELIERAIRESGIPDRTQALREYILSAFAPTPTLLPVTDILFDAWALTTIKDKLPGRPPVEPYLHGITDETFDTEFAWRQEVGLLKGEGFNDAITTLLDEFPLKPHETLKVPTFHKKNGAYLHLETIRERDPNQPAWVIEPSGDVTVFATLTELLKKEGKDDYAVRLAERTVILPPKAGGLTATGTLDGTAVYVSEKGNYDVASNPPAKVAPLLRLLVATTESGQTVASFGPPTSELWEGEIAVQPGEKWLTSVNRQLRADGKKPIRAIFTLDIPDPNNEDAPPKQYVVVKPVQTRSGDVPAAEWSALDNHLNGVAGFAKGIVSGIKLDAKLAKAVELAAAWHDHGKARTVWQRGAGNFGKHSPVAKTLHGRPPENLNHYRHELGSMVDVSTRDDLAKQFDDLDDEYKEVVLHLIATHHGRGRPHFPPDESHDLDRPTEVVSALAAGTPGRFARLQRRFGRWGLAYLESLLRAADVLESQRIESAPIPDAKEWPKSESITPPTLRPLVSKPPPNPSITVAVDPTNPGQFFACCGLLELADRLWPGAEGWFAVDGREFKIACEGTLTELLDAVLKAELTLTSPEDADGKKDIYSGPGHLAGRFNLTLDWWLDGGYAETDPARGSRLKPWAGTMESVGIAQAMQQALDRPGMDADPFNISLVVPKPGEPKKKKEPFHFDSRRGANALPLDIGFVQDALGIQTLAHPAVEFFALVGLQRCRPRPTDTPRVFDYFIWSVPCGTSVLPTAVCGLLGRPRTFGFRFENAFRTGQKKHKAFNPATPLGESR